MYHGNTNHKKAGMAILTRGIRLQDEEAYQY